MDERERKGQTDDVVAVEIGDVLDLHTFRPRDVPELVRDYIDECLERGFDQVRIIHGKGIGNLRRTVHAVLQRHEGVEEYSLAGDSAGGWGATLVRLRVP
ncbi:MAG: Smr/MutS family protein [Proteobacteria bacterium]|nr:Smr/MutS family protein [Pseudomonadota bacterium]